MLAAVIFVRALVSGADGPERVNCNLRAVRAGSENARQLAEVLGPLGDGVAAETDRIALIVDQRLCSLCSVCELAREVLRTFSIHAKEGAVGISSEEERSGMGVAGERCEV